VRVSWWTARAEHTLTEQIPAPPGEVRAFYVDLDNIRLVHPLVMSVRTVSRTETPDGYEQTYRVQDRLKRGPFALRIGYTARLHVPAGGDVTTEAHQFPRVVLRGVVSFDETGEGTRLTERINIEAPSPLAGVTTREAVKAHIEMLAGIRRHFEQ
jgi:ligand-binding SRPBCC domain-containing protein